MTEFWPPYSLELFKESRTVLALAFDHALLNTTAEFAPPTTPVLEGVRRVPFTLLAMHMDQLVVVFIPEKVTPRRYTLTTVGAEPGPPVG